MKFLFCTFWNSSGVLYYELLQKGQAVTSDVYCRLLTKVAEKYHSFYGRTTKRCSPILLHDKARPHTSNQTKKCLSELNFEVLPHPPYSPDMAPTNFHLFRSLQHFLAEKMFNDIEEVKNCLNDFLLQKIWIFITTACISLSSVGERFLYQMACISLIKTFPFL